MLGPSSTDSVLWESIVLNNEKAFALLFDRYWLRLYKTAVYFSKDEESSKDIVNTVFLTIWNRREVLVIDNFVNYLNSATRHEVFKFLKKRKAAKVSYVEQYPEHLEESVQNEALLRLSKTDIENELAVQLKKLPKRSATIFHMSKIQQLKNEEIAQILGITKHTVENQLSHAVKHLQIAFKNLPILLLILGSYYR